MKFGLIGYPLSHSFSKKYFEAKFRDEQIINCAYENFEFSSIDQLPSMIADNADLRGFNITIPYKEQVIPYLNHQNNIVQETGACNCVHIIDRQLHGFNTDVAGFEQSLQAKLQPHHDRALILGTGGASKAVAYVLNRLGISYSYVSRSNSLHSGYLHYNDLSDEQLQTHTLIINTTPSGMYPNTDTAPPLNYNTIGPRHYLFDLIYNPAQTLFLQEGESRGAVTKNGHDMLIIQAEESWKIWTGKMH